MPVTAKYCLLRYKICILTLPNNINLYWLYIDTSQQYRNNESLLYRNMWLHNNQKNHCWQANSKLNTIVKPHNYKNKTFQGKHQQWQYSIYSLWIRSNRKYWRENNSKSISLDKRHKGLTATLSPIHLDPFAFQLTIRHGPQEIQGQHWI